MFFHMLLKHSYDPHSVAITKHNANLTIHLNLLTLSSSGYSAEFFVPPQGRLHDNISLNLYVFHPSIVSPFPCKLTVTLYFDIAEEDLNREEEDGSFSYKKMIDRDRKRWKVNEIF